MSARTGHVWMPWEDNKLHGYIHSGLSPPVIAMKLKRTSWAIACRADKKFDVHWDGKQWEAIRCNAPAVSLGDLLNEAVNWEEVERRAAIYLGNKGQNVGMYKFWMCVVDGGNPPHVRHDSLNKATTEANRLCIVTGKRAYVVESRGYFDPPTIPAVVWRDTP